MKNTSHWTVAPFFAPLVGLIRRADSKLVVSTVIFPLVLVAGCTGSVGTNSGGIRSAATNSGSASAGSNLVGASTAGRIQTSTAKDFTPLTIHEIVVLPLAANQVINPDQAGELERTLLQALQASTGLKVINLESPERIAGLKLVGQSPRERAQALGVESSAQGVFILNVIRYEESAGGRFGAKDLAAVGFRLSLINPRNGRELWVGTFEDSDEPVTENLLRLPERMREGVAFRSTREIARQGLAILAQAFQSLR